MWGEWGRGGRGGEETQSMIHGVGNSTCNLSTNKLTYVLNGPLVTANIRVSIRVRSDDLPSNAILRMGSYVLCGSPLLLPQTTALPENQHNLKVPRRMEGHTNNIWPPGKPDVSNACLLSATSEVRGWSSHSLYVRSTCSPIELPRMGSS